MNSQERIYAWGPDLMIFAAFKKAARFSFLSVYQTKRQS